MQAEKTRALNFDVLVLYYDNSSLYTKNLVLVFIYLFIYFVSVFFQMSTFMMENMTFSTLPLLGYLSCIRFVKRSTLMFRVIYIAYI